MKRVRHALLLVLLGVLTIWPMVQFLMVRANGMNPAALGAWGEHAAPAPKPQLVVQLVDGNQRERILLSDMPRSVQNIGRDFLRRRSALGQLEKPVQLAEAILAAYDEPTGVEIQVIKNRLGPATAHIEASEATYAYSRSEFD